VPRAAPRERSSVAGGVAVCKTRKVQCKPFAPAAAGLIGLQRLAKAPKGPLRRRCSTWNILMRHELACEMTIGSQDRWLWPAAITSKQPHNRRVGAADLRRGL